MNRPIDIARLTSLLVLFCVTSIFLAATGKASDTVRPNVLLITVDTLRTDHISLYGYPWKTTPRIDQLAGRGVYVESATCQIPLTGPGHASILTAMYPQSHGAYRNGVRIRPDVATLGDVLKKSGYTTAAFVSAWTLRAKLTGLDQGFDLYNEETSHSYGGGINTERHADEVTDRAVAWLNKNAAGPFFLWVHYFDPHEPYRRRERFVDLPAARDGGGPLPARSKKTVLYDSEIAFADHEIGRLIDRVDALELRESTMIVLTTDHGESFGEHGYWGHGRRIYENNVRVPMIFSMPGRLPEGRRVLVDAQSIDITPTLLDFLDLEPLAQAQGISIASWIAGEEEARFTREVFSLTYPGAVGHLPKFIRDFFQKKTPSLPIRLGIRIGDRKFIYHPQKKVSELYDLGVDPGEEHNLITKANRRSYDHYRTKVTQWFEATKGALGEESLSDEDREKLKSLGYGN